MTGQGKLGQRDMCKELWAVELRSEEYLSDKIGSEDIEESCLDHRMQIRRSVIRGAVTRNYGFYFYFYLCFYVFIFMHFKTKWSKSEDKP